MNVILYLISIKFDFDNKYELLIIKIMDNQYYINIKHYIGKYKWQYKHNYRAMNLSDVIIYLEDIIKLYFFTKYEITNYVLCKKQCLCRGKGIHVDICKDNEKIELLLVPHKFKIKNLTKYKNKLIELVEKQSCLFADIFEYKQRIKDKNMLELKNYIIYRNFKINPEKFFFKITLINKVIEFERERLFLKYS